MTRSIISALLVLAALPASANALAGKREKHTYPNGYRAIQYTPAALDTSKPAPLFVMVHGCNTTAEQQEAANGLDEQAEHDGFVVLYLDHEGNPVVHPALCWRFPTDTERDSPDPAAIVAMVRDTIVRATPPIDPRRVYYAGMSSGAMLGSIVAATYPEVFAAFMLNAGCAYKATTCAFTPPSQPTDTLAHDAYDAMGEHRRVVPVLVSQGDKDGTVPPAHSQQTLDQWRMTDNLVTTGNLDGPLAAQPTTTREVAEPGHYPSSVTTFNDPSGCRILERWVIHGMDHFWPGGSSDPASAPFTDPKGPNGGEIAWNFFKRYRLVTSGSPCVPPATTHRRCTKRQVLNVRVPRRLRHLRVVLDGRRLVVRHGHVTIDLRHHRVGTARLVFRGRTSAGKTVRIVRRYRICR